MDFKELLTKILSEVKKDEITISTEFNNNSEIVNKSKIGGKPYLPKDFIWPYYQGLPLSGNKLSLSKALTSSKLICAKKDKGSS